jgi:ATP dependent DNA ligase domain
VIAGRAYSTLLARTGAPTSGTFSMHLPVNPPVLPMLAKPIGKLPDGDGWIFEPKWDGFRALVFRDGDEIFIQSRDAKPLVRYYPELVAPLKAQLPERCVLDGEIVIVRPGGLDFEALQLRLHPAASRVEMLSKEIPASFVCFDLLSEGICHSACNASRSGAHCLIENVTEDRAPMTGGASPNRAGGANGETYQHGCAARGSMGGGGALRSGATARKRAHSGRTNGDDGLASQARGTGAIGRRGELEAPTAFL